MMQLRGIAERLPANQERREDADHADCDADDAAPGMNHRHGHALVIGMVTAVLVLIRRRDQLRLIGDQRDDQKCQQGTGRDQPGQCVRVVEEIHPVLTLSARRLVPVLPNAGCDKP